MKKKIGFSVIIALTLLSLFFVGRKQYEIYSVSKKQKNTTQQLPELNLISIDENKINTTSFKKLPIFKLFVIFNSNCDHCDNQITELIQKVEKLNKVFVFFISPEPVLSLKKYGEKFKIKRFNNMLMLNIDATTLNKTFDCTTTPTLYLYNADNILERKFKGETPFEVVF